MPIFEENGQRYNVKDEYFGDFVKEYPEASTIMERDGQMYRVKAKDYASFEAEYPITSQYTFTASQLGVEPEKQEKEVLTGFGEGVSQGADQLYQGNKYLLGEYGRVYSGGQEDARKALDYLNTRDASFSGKDFDVNKAIEDASKEQWQKDMAEYSKVKAARRKERAEGDMGFWEKIKHKWNDPSMPDLKDAELIRSRNASHQRYLIDVAEALRETDGDVEKAKAILEEKASKETWSDRMKREASEAMASHKPVEGAAWWGSMLPQVAAQGVSLAASAIPGVGPILGRVLGLGTTGLLTSSSAGAAMHEARQAGASDAEVFSAGVTAATIEAGSEQIPLNRLLGKIGSKAFKKGYKAVAGNIAEEELEKLLNEGQKSLGVKILSGKTAKELIKDIGVEGASEFVAEFLGTYVPTIYLNEDEYPTLKEAIANGWEGFKAGAAMGGFLGGATNVITNTQNEMRRRKQGAVTLASDANGNVVEVLGEMDGMTFVLTKDGETKTIKGKPADIATFSYDEWQSGVVDMQMQAIENEHRNGYNAKDNELFEIGEAYTRHKQQVESILSSKDLGWLEEDPIGILKGLSEHYTEEEVAAAEEYVKAKARYGGALQRINEEIEERIAASDKEIDGRTNENDKLIHPAVLKDDRRVYIVSGSVLPLDDGSVDVRRSDDFIIVRDAETGELLPSSAREVMSVNAVIPAQAEKTAVAETIREQISTEKARLFETPHAVSGEVADIANVGTSQSETAGKDYEVDDEVFLDVNGNRVRGVVAGKPSRDGVTIQTDVPVNGKNVQVFSREDLGKMLVKESEPQVEDNASPAEIVELPDVPDFFNMNGNNYEVVARNNDGSVEVKDSEGNRSTLPYGQDYSKILPTDKKGEVQYTDMPVERTLQSFAELLPDNVVRSEVIENNVKAAKKALEKFDKKPDVGTDPMKVAQIMEKWNADKKAAQDKVDYWKEVAKRNTEISESEIQGDVYSGGENAASQGNRQPVISETPQPANEMQPAANGDVVSPVAEVENQTGNNTEMVEPSGNEVAVDSQGNPVDANGKLIVEEVASIDDITDEDFDSPARNVQLPTIPENVASAIGTEGRPVIIKKNVFEKNGNTHVELEPADSREILKSALYNPNLVGTTQPIKRPDYKVAIRTGEKNAVVVLDVFQDKEHVEIVGWRLVNEKGLAKMQRQAEREGGQFLILSPNEGSAAALSALPFGLSSESEGINIVSNEQENSVKSDEIAENWYEYDVYLEEIKALGERQQAVALKLPRPSSFVEAYTSNDTEAINKLDKQLDDALQMLVPMDITMVDATIRGMKDRKSIIKAGSANERKELPTYKAFDHIEKALTKRKKQLEKKLTEDEKRRLDIVERGKRGELKEDPAAEQTKQKNESIDDEAPVTSGQPEMNEVTNDGPVNVGTLQLNMGEEDFNALLNGGDKTAISEYLAELDGALRIDENSPFAGQDALREEYRKAVEQYGKENIPAEVMQSLNERMQPYSDLSRAIFDRKYALQDKLRELESDEKVAEAERESAAKAEHKQTAFNGFLAGKSDLGASTAEKALSKKYNFDGKVMTVAEFVENAVGNGNVKLSAIEEPKYKGASRAAWNRMDARQQEADAKKVKESGTKTVYTVNDHDFGKTAYDYAKFLQEKTTEDGKAVLYRSSEDVYTPEEQEIIDRAKADGTYIKAPNGKPSKLSPKQWAQVRTANFKKWFGDWEKVARIEKLKRSEPVDVEFKNEYELNRGSAKQWMKDNLRGEYTNADTGESITISKVGINEVTSHGSKDDAHLISLKAVPRFIENSVFIEEVPNAKGNDKYDSYRYYVCGARIKGEDYTVKVVVGVKGNSKFYDHRLTQIEKGALIDNLDGLSNSVAENQNTSLVGKDSKLISILQTNSSKVVDENGEPMVVYHRTPNEFTTFDPAMIGASTDAGAFGSGFYLSPADFGSLYGKNLMPLFVNLKNPLMLNDANAFDTKEPFFGEDYSWGKEQAENFSTWVKENGYDGVWYENNGRDEIVATEPSQMKSATENNGEFSAENNDIHYRSGAGPLTDREVVMDSDPYSKALGRPRYTGKKMSDYVERHRTRMAQRVQDMAQKLNIDIEVLQSTEGLTSKKALAKGWFDPKSEKITVVIPNHTSVGDVMETVLHEAVAHHGLRKLFGKDFYTFLDNVYNSATPDLRGRITELAKRNGWDFHTATEEYLASLAESTEFEFAHKQGWWQKIKSLFLEMLDKIGLKGFGGGTITDNELRYVLWRSYQNLAYPGMYNSVFGQAEDIAKQYELKVGNYSTTPQNGLMASEGVRGYEIAEDEDDVYRMGDGYSGFMINGELVPDKFVHAINYSANWTKKHKGAARCIVIQNGEKLRDRLERAGFTQDEIADAEKLYNEGTCAVYSPTQDKVLIFDTDATENEIIGYLWHENAHRAVGQLYTQEEIENLFKKIVGEAELDIRKELAASGYEESGQAEEFIVRMLEELYLARPELVESGKFKVKNNSYDFDWNIAEGTIKPIINFINNGNREDARRDAVRRLDGNGIQLSDGKAEVGKNVEVRNAETEISAKGTTLKARRGDPEARIRTLARDRYEERMKNGMFQSQEALQDSMLSLKEAMMAIFGKNVNIEDVDGFENAYLGENRLSSVNRAEADAYNRMVFKPLLDEVAKLAPTEEARTELVDYMFAKHGIERTRDMSVKMALTEPVDGKPKFKKDAYKQYLAEKEAVIANGKSWAEQYHELNALASMYGAKMKDVAGLVVLTETGNIDDAMTAAYDMVNEYERIHNANTLWKRVNDASKAVLQKSYESGLISKEVYNEISKMYQFYIPLRGFDEDTSSEAYAYLTHKEGAFNAPIKKAKGRSSKADDPFANLQSMAESTIMQGNRNTLVKQRFLNFVLNHPSDLVSVNELWLEYDEVADEWRPVFPDNIKSGDSAEVVEQKMRDFEMKMEALAEKDPDKYKRGKDAVDIPYKVVADKDMKEHHVLVKRGGRDIVLTVNGNPRLAQALNGLTNPDSNLEGTAGALLRAGEKINRQLSALYTTRNPDFIVSNFLRDLLYTNSMVWVKENPRYALRYNRNYSTVANIANMKRLLSKYRQGTLDMNNRTEELFQLFMENGGETGYVNLRDIEKLKSDIDKELKKANGKMPVRKALELLGDRLDELNRAIENSARFAAFVTSIEMGRTVDRAIYDAKEISVNFNKKGAGDKFAKANGQTDLGKASAYVSGAGRVFYVFWNAAIQGTANFGRQAKRHPKKALAAGAAMFLMGALAAFMGGDDDEEKNGYYDLPEYVRRSNIIFRAGNSWISIPLPIEYRAFYGMGELMSSVIGGKEHLTDTELAEAIASQLSQVLPVDVLEGGGGLNAFVPSAAKPLWEAYVLEKSWTGMPLYKNYTWNKDMPEWTKAYKGANKYLVGLSEVLNEATGGDKYTKGKVDINPAKVEAVLNGYLGGVSGTIDKLVKMAETAVGEREYDPKNMLLLNRVVKAGDESTEYRAVNNEYYRAEKEAKEIARRLRNYENDTYNGVFDFAEKIDFLYNSPEYLRYEIYECYRPEIEDLNAELKAAEELGLNEEVETLKAELNETKRTMLKEMDETRE